MFSATFQSADRFLSVKFQYRRNPLKLQVIEKNEEEKN